MTKKLLGRYTNGNYEVMIWNDGTCQFKPSHL